MKKRGLYKMNTISQRTGFSPALLRAWERRHELLEPERTEGGHRLYTDDDLAVLLQVRELLRGGRAIGEVASLGRKGLLAQSSTRSPSTTLPESGQLSKELASEVNGWSQALVTAAVAVDEAGVEAALDQAFVVLSPLVALNQVVMPALVVIGDLWAQGRASVAGEHLASAKVTGRLLKLLETVNPASGNGARPAICACLPDEQHQIGALMAAYTMARHHYRVSYLGGCLPLEDLELSCQLLSPQLVCLSVSRESLLLTHKPRLLELVPRLPKTTRVFLGGRGVERADRDLARAGVTVLHPGGPNLEELLRGGAAIRKKTRKRTRR